MTITYRHSLSGEGAGSMYQREVMTLLAALISHQEFYRTENHLSRDHYLESEYESHVVGWNSVLKFLNSFSIGEPEIDDDLRFMTFQQVMSIIDAAEDEHFAQALSRIRQQLKSNGEIRAKPKITIHLRGKSRGDVLLGFDSLPYEYVDHDYGLPCDNPDYYSRLYTRLLNVVAADAGCEIDVVVCSSANVLFLQNFFRGLDGEINLHIASRPDYEDFKHMVDCDLLIMAKSSLSYLASMLNPNEKYIRKGYRHRLPPDVTIFNDEDYLDLCFNEKYGDGVGRLFKKTMHKLSTMR